MKRKGLIQSIEFLWHTIALKSADLSQRVRASDFQLSPRVCHLSSCSLVCKYVILCLHFTLQFLIFYNRSCDRLQPHESRSRTATIAQCNVVVIIAAGLFIAFEINGGYYYAGFFDIWLNFTLFTIYIVYIVVSPNCG